MTYYFAIVIYVTMSHSFEKTGMHYLCAALAEETKLKRRARSIVEYAVPAVARVIVAVIVVILTGNALRDL